MPITDEELKAEWQEEMRMEAHEEAYYSKKMYDDFDYAVKHLGIDKHSTIEEVGKAANTLREYGHNCSPYELVELVL